MAFAPTWCKTESDSLNFVQETLSIIILCTSIDYNMIADIELYCNLEDIVPERQYVVLFLDMYNYYNTVNPCHVKWCAVV